jgi:hypothetical protein
MATVRGKGRTRKGVPKSYRLRADIVAEVEGMLKLVNRDLGIYDDGYITETFVVECALSMFVKKFKAGLTTFHTLKETGKKEV